jgi:hypothetical protein
MFQNKIFSIIINLIYGFETNVNEVFPVLDLIKLLKYQDENGKKCKIVFSTEILKEFHSPTNSKMIINS